MTPIDMYRAATTRALQVAAGVRPEQLGDPTPCTDWTVQDLLDHLTGGTSYLATALGAEPMDPPTGSTAADLEAGIAACLDRMGDSGRARAPLALAARLRVVGPRGDRRHVDGRARAHLGPRHRDRTGHHPRPRGRRRLHRDVPACHARGRSGRRDHRSRGGGGARRVAPGPAAGGTGPTAVTSDPVEDGLQALAHRGRRTMLRLVQDGERTSSELAEAAGLTRSAASQHLRILREAGLVHVRVDANRRLYRADLDRLAALRESLDDFWGDRLGELKRVVESASGQRSRKRRAG